MRAHQQRFCTVALLSILLGGDPLRPEDPPPLFELGSEVFTLSSGAAVGEFEIALDLERLRSAAPVLTLALPGIGIEAARRVGIEHRSGGNLTWTGVLGPDAAPGRNVVLTVEKGLVSGIVFLADRAFQIVPRSGGHRLVIIDPDLFPDCGGEVAPALPPGGAPRASVSAPPPGPVNIDLLVVYTPAARAAAGGVDEIEATVQSAVDVAKTAYFNSWVSPHLALTHTAEVAYSEAASVAADLDWVSTDPGVAALRDAWHADLVALIVTGSSSCGIAFVQSDPDPAFESAAFQVTRLDCAFANLSLAHELAHLQGAEHNPEDSVRWPSAGSFPWSFGHYHHGGFRTVMSISASCAPPCPRLPYFSNPDISFGGLPTGVADLRENFRTINATAPIVAGFRQRPPSIFADAFESGDATAWSCLSAECEP